MELKKFFLFFFPLEKIKKRDLFFSLFCLLIILILMFIPSAYEGAYQSKGIPVAARVLSVDDSGIQQIGIIKQGTQSLVLEISQGRWKGQSIAADNPLYGTFELDKIFKPGDRAFTVLSINNEGNIVSARVMDHYRLDVIFILLGLFFLFLFIFAGFTGLKAILSFVLTGVVIWKILLPGFLAGISPLPFAFGIVCFLTGSIIFLVGGTNRKGLHAFLGSISGVGLTCLLSLFFGHLFKLHGAVRPFAETLLQSGHFYLDMTGIFLAGIFISASGAVMDIAMDVAAAVDEIKNHAPQISRLELMLSGLKVARPVIGTMTTTLVFAYSGGFTAMFMAFIAQGVPLLNVINMHYVAAEILQTVVGSFGLVSVAPFTALISSFLGGKKNNS